MFIEGNSSSDAQHIKMTQTPIPKLVVSMSVPSVAAQLITIIYNTADTYFVSHIDTAASGAVGVAFSLMAIIQAFGFGLSMGANSLISRKLGEKKVEQATVYANSGLFATVIVGFMLLAIGLPNLEWLMRILGSTENVLPYACDYAKYILIAAPVSCASFMLNNIIRAQGKAFLSMIGMCIGACVNMMLDPLLITTFDMGISGAAIATVISQLISVIVMLCFFFGGKTIIRLSFGKISKNIGDYIEICKIGFPTICRQGMASIASALLNNTAKIYGDAALSAITISNKIYMLLRNIVLGIGQGFQPIAGYNFGAKIYDRVKKSFIFSCILGTVVCTAACIITLPLAEGIMGIFIENDAEVIEIGAKALRFSCAVMPMLAYSTLVNQMYQCLGFSTVAAILASCRQGIFFIPYILITPSIIGLLSIQTVQPFADALTFAVSIPFQIVFFRKILNKKG